VSHRTVITCAWASLAVMLKRITIKQHIISAINLYRIAVVPLVGRKEAHRLLWIVSSAPIVALGGARMISAQVQCLGILTKLKRRVDPVAAVSDHRSREGAAVQSRYGRDANRPPAWRPSGDALSLHPRRANRERLGI
jgi:hypothetical protein